MPAQSEDELRHEVRGWIRDHWDPQLTVRSWWALLAESGWGYPTWPSEWFGRGLGVLDALAINEELTDAGVLGPPVGVGASMGAPMLFAHGSEEQKQRWVPAIARGEENWCQFFSEPGAGSDLASVQTRTVRDGDEWVVNGQKVWNSGTLVADRGLLVARSDPDVPKHNGISMFVIPVDQPGIDIRPIRQMNGRSEFNEAFFTDARVADADLVGGVDHGFAVAMTTLTHERATFAGGGDRTLRHAVAGPKGGDLDRRVADVLADEASARDSANKLPVGTPEAMIALARRFGRERDPLVRQRIAHLYATSEALRFTALRSQSAARAGRALGPESSIGYLGGVAVVRLCRDLSASIAGVNGLLTDPANPDSAVAESVTTAPCHGIQGGSEQIQRNVIGERILGLPKEPQVDRDVPFRQIRVGTQRSS